MCSQRGHKGLRHLCAPHMPLPPQRLNVFFVFRGIARKVDSSDIQTTRTLYIIRIIYYNINNMRV